MLERTEDRVARERQPDYQIGPATTKPQARSNAIKMTKIADENFMQRVRFVLSNTSHPGNIGAAARAIRTMGFSRLVLVAPHAFPHADAKAMAANADAVLEQAVVVPQLPQAIADCRFVLGATARRRGVVMQEFDPRAAASRVLERAAAGDEVAVVFGNEQSGLANDEIERCHGAISIPSDPSYSSLNLAQAVQVIAYEVRMAWLAGQTARLAQRNEAVATAAEMDVYFSHLAETLDAIDFHKGRSPRTIMQRLRRLFLRAEPDRRELRVLHGILSDASRMAMLARGRE